MATVHSIQLEQRVGLFVDVSNMYYSAKNIYGQKVDFSKILRTGVANRKLIRAFTYVIKADIESEGDFFSALATQGYEVRSKDLQVFFGGAKKGDWDIGMAIDAIKLADKLDVVILVTGDGDFVPLVGYLQENKGCRVEVMAFGKTTSNSLIEKADYFIDLDDDHKNFLIPDRKSKRKPKINS